MFFRPTSPAKEHVHPDGDSFRRTTNASGGQQADNKFSLKIVVRKMGCCPPNPFSGGQRCDFDHPVVRVVRLVRQARKARHIKGLRGGQQIRKAPYLLSACCPPVVRHTIYDMGGRRGQGGQQTIQNAHTRRTTHRGKFSLFFYLYRGRTDHTHSTPSGYSQREEWRLFSYAILSHRNAPVSRSVFRWANGSGKGAGGQDGAPLRRADHFRGLTKMVSIILVEPRT